MRVEAERIHAGLSARGLRVLGVAYGETDVMSEADMILLGFLALHDPLKSDTAHAVAELRRLGVALKVITGDNRLVAAADRFRCGAPRGVMK